MKKYIDPWSIALLAFMGIVNLQSCESEVVLPDIQDVESGTILTIAGGGPDRFGYDGDGGSALSASLGWVVDVALDSDNNLYIVDGAANNVRMVSDDNGNIQTIAGKFMGFNNSGSQYAGDGGPAREALLNVCLKIALDPAQNLLITDNGNNVIRQVTSNDQLISTIVGSFPGEAGYEGDGGSATDALVSNPQGIALDAEGDLFISDTQNNTIRRVSRATGVITTIAGLGPDQPGYSGDGGPAIESTLNSPAGLVLDANGNIYFSDKGNNVIRKISNGIITTIAGNGDSGNTGDGAPALNASIMAVNGLAVDRDGNIYLTSGNKIRMVDQATGTISTVVGTGEEGYSGDGGPAIEAKLSTPWGITVDSEGNLYIADSGNSAIRMVVK